MKFSSGNSSITIVDICMEQSREELNQQITEAIYSKISRWWKQTPLENDKRKQNGFDVEKNLDRLERVLTWYFEEYQGINIDMDWYAQWLPFANEETVELYNDWNEGELEEDTFEFEELKLNLLCACKPLKDRIEQMCKDGTLYDPEPIDTSKLVSHSITVVSPNAPYDPDDDQLEFIRNVVNEPIRYRFMYMLNESGYEVIFCVFDEKFYALTQTNEDCAEFASMIADVSSGGQYYGVNNFELEFCPDDDLIKIYNSHYI